MFKILKNKNLKESEKVCPKCGQKYTGYPALSRKDNKTEICPDCGTEEAIEDYLSAMKHESRDRVAETIGKFIHDLNDDAWSYNGETKTLGGKTIYDIRKNGKAEISNEELIKMVLDEYPELEPVQGWRNDGDRISFKRKVTLDESKELTLEAFGLNLSDMRVEDGMLKVKINGKEYGYKHDTLSPEQLKDKFDSIAKHSEGKAFAWLKAHSKLVSGGKSKNESINKLMESVAWGYFDKFKEIDDKYMPDQGEGETMASQIVTAINKLIYKWYNDGDVYDNVNSGMTGWANDLSDYANWLDKYCKPASKILADIYSCSNDDEYEDILKELADKCLDEKYLMTMEEKSKQGSIYNCDGKYKFEEQDENDEWEDYTVDFDDEEDEDDYLGENKHKSLNEKAWKLTLDNSIRKAIENEDNKEIINCLRKYNETIQNSDILDDLVKEEFQDFFDENELDMDDILNDELSDEEDIEDIINYLLDDFYDLCDATDVFISINESLKESYSRAKELYDAGDFAAASAELEASDINDVLRNLCKDPDKEFFAEFINDCLNGRVQCNFRNKHKDHKNEHNVTESKQLKENNEGNQVEIMHFNNRLNEVRDMLDNAFDKGNSVLIEKYLTMIQTMIDKYLD